VLAGDLEELADRPGPHLAQGLQHAFDHGAEQFGGLQVERRPRQPRIFLIEQPGAQKVQPIDRPPQQRPHHGLSRRIDRLPGQLIEVPLNRDGGPRRVHGPPLYPAVVPGRVYLPLENSALTARGAYPTSPRAAFLEWCQAHTCVLSATPRRSA